MFWDTLYQPWTSLTSGAHQMSYIKFFAFALLSLTGTGKWFPAAGNVTLNWLALLPPFVFVRAPCGCSRFLPHVGAVFCLCLALWKRGESRYRRLGLSHMATLQVMFGRAVLWRNYFHTNVRNRGRLTLVAPSKNQPFHCRHCLMPLNSFLSTSLLFTTLSLSSFAFSLCCSLHLFFSLLLRSAHFSRTPFPSGSQATKYSDWCRQLGFITNGKRSREHEHRDDFWLVRQLNPC